MQKKILFLALFLLQFLFSNAQNTATLSGKVKENESDALEFASVFLSMKDDSTKTLKAATTDSLGQFSIKNIAFDTYILKVQMIGFATSRRLVLISEREKNLILPTILLEKDTKLLNQVNIIAKKQLITRTSQGFIINAKDNLAQAAGSATDLLRSTPTVVVDAEGAITVRGKSPMILVNGRNSSLTNTDRIPASSIESIEIMNNPSAQFDADAEGGIINITLKKNKEQGTNGAVGIGAGYGARGRFNSSVILGHQTEKWNFEAAYDNRFAERVRAANANRTNYDLPDEYFLIQKRNDNRVENTQNLKFNFDFKPNKKHNFGLEILGNTEGQNNQERLISTLERKNQDFNNSNTRFSSELSNEKALEFAFDYRRKFDNKRQKFSVNISNSFNQEKENTDITTQALTENATPLGSIFLQQTRNYQNSNINNYKLDYAHPIGKNAVFETGYKGITRSTNADFVSGFVKNNSFFENPLASNSFDFKEQIHAAYLQFRDFTGELDAPKWKYELGIRAENVTNQGKASKIDFKNDYLKFFPSANVAYYLNASDFVKVSYNRRINRPNLGQLNPFVDITDSLNQHGGNPYLKPELANAFETSYNANWEKATLSASIFYRYSTDIIRPFITLNNKGIALLQPKNFGNATTYGFESIATFDVNKFWSMNTSFSIFQQSFSGNIDNSLIENKVLSWYAKMGQNFSLWKNGKLQILGNYNAPIATPQGTRIAVYNVDMGFQQKIWNNKGAFGLIMTDVFNTQKSGLTAMAQNFDYKRSFKIDTRAVLLTFTYSFRTKLKEELMENRFLND